MAPVVKEAEEQKENVPKLLCRLDNHLSCVNCVRWSNNGRNLASAGDDKVIMIWQFCGQGGSSFGGVINAEQWRCVHNLRGHSGDILDLNWSPQDRFLASCSVDNTVRIWNAELFPECLRTITGHSAFVKGVCWDPMNKYLASQSDDKSLKVWRTSDWKEETSVVKPFEDCGGTTHVLRLGWSPDGQFLVSAHAMNNLGSTAQIIDRNNWNTEKDFVGHRKAVTCVRFSPQMRYKQRKEKKSKFFCLAVGSRDRSLSIWLTNLRRPLMVMHELFADSVLDISWFKDGRGFLACSWDGTVAYFEFTNEEIGKTLEPDDYSAYLHKLYGKSMVDSRPQAELDLFVEDVQLLEARKTAHEKEKVQNGTNASQHSISRPSNTQDSSNSRLMKGPTDKQIEMRLSDGRRRITPLYIPPISTGDGTPVPFSSNSETTFGSSKDTSSKIVIEHVDLPAPSSPSPKSSDGPRLTNGGDANNSTKVIVNGTSHQESIVNNTTSSDFNGLHTSQDQPDLLKKVSRLIPKHVPSSQAKESDSGTSQVDKSKLKRKSDVQNSLLVAPPPPPKVACEEAKQTAKTIGTDKRSTERPSRSESKVTLNLFPLRIEKMHSQSVTFDPSESSGSGAALQHPCICVENEVINNLSSVKLVDDVQAHWQVLLSGRISALCTSNKFLCVFCEDCSLHVFRVRTGARVFSPLVVSGAAAKVRCIDARLLLITSKAALWMWDLNSQKVLLRNVSLAALTANSPENNVDIVRLTLSATGSPIIALSSGRSYIYNGDLETWQLVGDSLNQLHHCCDLASPRIHTEYSLAQLQR
jgi:protein HIRA/HIR1